MILYAKHTYISVNQRIKFARFKKWCYLCCVI